MWNLLFTSLMACKEVNAESRDFTIRRCLAEYCSLHFETSPGLWLLRLPHMS